MYAWEAAYQEKLKLARSVEMVPLFLLHVIDGVMDSLFTATSSIVSIEEKWSNDLNIIAPISYYYATEHFP